MIRTRTGRHLDEHLYELAEMTRDEDLTDEDLERMKRQAEEDAAEATYF